MKVKYNKEGIGNQFLFDVVETMNKNQPDKVKIIGNRVIFPESVASGYMSYHKLGDDIDLTIYNHTYNIPMYIERMPTNDAKFFSIYINCSQSEITYLLGDQDEKIETPHTCACIWTTSDMTAAFKMEPGETLSGIIIHMTREYLQTVLGDKLSISKEDVASTILDKIVHQNSLADNNTGERQVNPINSTLRFLHSKLNKVNFELVQEIISLDKSTSAAETLLLRANVLKILSLFIQRVSSKEERKESTTHFTDVAKIMEVKKLIDDRAAKEHISLNDLAKIAAISKTKLKLKFKEIVGETVYQYYLNVKMEKAKEILEDNPVPISNLAYEMGFNSTSHFSQVFKKYHSVSPRTISSRNLEMTKTMVSN